MALPGYRRASGSSRNYVNTATGKSISRRQYDKLVSAAGARKTASPEVKSRQRSGQNAFNVNLDEFVKSRRAAGEKITKREGRSDPRFKEIQDQWRGKPVRRNKNGKPNRNDVAANRRRREKAVRELGMTMKEWREAYEKDKGSLVRDPLPPPVSRAARQGREGRGA